MTMVTSRPKGHVRPVRDPAAEATGPAAEAPGPATQPAHRHTARYAVPSLRGRRPSARVLWATTAVLVLAVVGVALTLGRATWTDQRAADDRAAALAAGRQIAVNFVTVSAAAFDTDTRRVLDDATGSFKKEYEATLAQLKPVVTANHTDSRVERAEAALVSADDHSAKVIVGIVAPTTNSATTTPEKKTYRLRLDLVKVGDAWKVSALDFVS
ncbi:hypothetical protein GCM10027053_02710 [Intrasporangium mesophilum]